MHDHSTSDRTATETGRTDTAVDASRTDTAVDAVADTDADADTVEPDAEPDYERVLDEFGADPVTAAQRERFPDPVHPLVSRGVYYAGRGVDRYLDAVAAGERVSVVTGVGPSGPMHLGHVIPFYFAKYLQESADATVYVPLSDDEKYCSRDQTLAETRRYARENLRDLVAVGFDPDRTRFVVDTADADVVYPLATSLAKGLTPATVEAVYGEPPNVGTGFYPAVQAAHLLLPQFVHGAHPTLVPVAVDQDPHVRVCRDLAAKNRYDVEKPGALLGKFLPGLTGPGKMSSSTSANGGGGDGDGGSDIGGGDSDNDTDGASVPRITLTDSRDEVREKVMAYAHSGGRSTVAAHREHGGDPSVDVAYRYLHAFFEPDDATVERLAAEYRAGDLLTGELKRYAADRIADFLDEHQSRRPSDDDLEDALAPYRLTDDERERALAAVGLAPGVRALE